MELVKNAEFFHFQLDPLLNWGDVHVERWEVGKTYSIGEQSNLYFNFFETMTLGRPTSNGLVSPSVFLAEHIDKVRRGREPQRPEFMDLYSDSFDLMLHSLKKTASLVGELVFEDIRFREFPDHPSRQRCIWVLPSKESALEWNNRVPTPKRWLRLALTGRIHRADSDHLFADTVSLTEWRRCARSYWRGDPSSASSSLDEILFEGQVRVLDELTPAEMGIV